MSKKVKKKENDDDEFIPGPSKYLPKNKTEMHCIIHCTDSIEELVMLPSIESWKKLLEAAKIRQNQTVVNLAESTNEGDLPRVQYHMKCRKAFTHKGSLEVIKNKRQVMILSESYIFNDTHLCL